MEKNKKLSKAQVEQSHRGKVLQIFAGEVPLTLVEIDGVIDAIQEEHCYCLSREMPSEIKSTCEFSGANVGHGTCLIKKFKKYGRRDTKCESCKSERIVEQLNYIFKACFGSKYSAEWRKKREYKKRKKDEI
jgi:hypothetical protein